MENRNQQYRLIINGKGDEIVQNVETKKLYHTFSSYGKARGTHHSVVAKILREEAFLSCMSDQSASEKIIEGKVQGKKRLLVSCDWLLAKNLLSKWEIELFFKGCSLPEHEGYILTEKCNSSTPEVSQEKKEKSDLVNLFDFNGSSVRVITIKGDPWFVVKDLCNILEIVKIDSAIRCLDDDEKGTHSVSTPGGNQELSVASESGMYCLVLRSRKPQAKEFRKWVTSEVLPSIRKTGKYQVTSDDSVGATPETTKQLPQPKDEVIYSAIELSFHIWDYLPEIKYVKPLLEIVINSQSTLNNLAISEKQFDSIKYPTISHSRVSAFLDSGVETRLIDKPSTAKRREIMALLGWELMRDSKGVFYYQHLRLPK